MRRSIAATALPCWSVLTLLVAGLAPADLRADLPRADRPTLFDWPGSEPGDSDEVFEEIVTDRPDFTEASTTVGGGTLQFETGYTYGYDDDGPGSVYTHSYSETLVRYGVFADWFELRAAWNCSHEIAAPVSRSGVEDLYVGIKLGLTLQQGVLPEMALVPQMTVPTGSDELSSERVLPGANWLYGWDINDFIAIGGSTQFNRTIDEETGNEFTEWVQSWTVNYTLTDKLGAYTEWFAFFPHAADTARTEHYLDGGFTYKFTPDTQCDIRAGVGLNEAADDYFVGTGLSWRIR